MLYIELFQLLFIVNWLQLLLIRWQLNGGGIIPIKLQKPEAPFTIKNFLEYDKHTFIF